MEELQQMRDRERLLETELRRLCGENWQVSTPPRASEDVAS
jgi:hypothetical protein